MGVFLALASCAAMALRIIQAAGSGLWRDEGLVLFVAESATVADLIDFLRLHESHPPLFYLMLRSWRAAFGPSPFAAQGLCVLLGTALVPAAYLVGARMYSRRAGVIAAALVAAWPSLVYYSALVRPYSLLPLLGLASTYCLWSGLRGGGLGAWSGYVLAMLAMLYTHNWAWVFLAAHWGSALAWLAWFRGPWGAAWGWTLAQVGVAAGYAPWLPVMLYQVRHAGHYRNPNDSLYVRITDGVQLLNTALSPFTRLSISTLAAVGLVVAAGWLHRHRDRRPDLPQGWWASVLLMAAIPFLAWAVAVVLSGKTPMLLVRCLLIGTPCLLIAVAQIIASLSPPGRPALPAALVLLLVLADARVVAKRAPRVRSNARELAAAVAAQVRPSDLVVIAPDYIASSFNLYFRPDNREVVYPNEGRQGAVLVDDQLQRCADPQALERVEARLLQTWRQGQRVWLVVDHSGMSDEIPEADIPSAVAASKNYVQVAMLRANQLRRFLIGLYGPDHFAVVSAEPRALASEAFGLEAEVLGAFLFAPPELGSP